MDVFEFDLEWHLASRITYCSLNRGPEAVPALFAELEQAYCEDPDVLTFLDKMAAPWGLEIKVPLGLPKPNPADVKPRRKRREPVPDANPLGLRTQREAAALLRCSLKALRKYMDDGLLRYVEQPGRGKRPRRMPTDDHLAEFLKNQTKKDPPPQWASSKTRARRSGASTSNTVVVAFSDRPKSPPSGKRKR